MIVGHLLTPRPAGGVEFTRDVRLAWGEDGRLEAPQGAPDGGDALLIPGLVDAHVHLPQHRVRGRFQEALLPWLREHIWPEEARFSDRDYREAVAREFRDDADTIFAATVPYEAIRLLLSVAASMVARMTTANRLPSSVLLILPPLQRPSMAATRPPAIVERAK